MKGEVKYENLYYCSYVIQKRSMGKNYVKFIRIDYRKISPFYFPFLFFS